MRTSSKARLAGAGCGMSGFSRVTRCNRGNAQSRRDRPQAFPKQSKQSPAAAKPWPQDLPRHAAESGDAGIHRRPIGASGQEITMNSRTPLFAAVLLAACAAPALAQDDLPSLPAVQVVRFVAGCAHPVLPTQRDVADWTGLHNFGQAYAARGRLMAEIGRACQRPGISHVRVVMTADAAPDPSRRVARVLLPLR
ncbi:MAG: hypothetical protein L0H23_01430 [Luteimonas sp.]|nr:hypothetical protein [Luteimonas sp.]